MKRLLLLGLFLIPVVAFAKFKSIEHFFIPQSPVTIQQHQAEYFYFVLKDGTELAILPDGSFQIDMCCTPTNDKLVEFFRRFAKENQ